MKNIVVTTDLSESSTAAFSHAAALAKGFSATLHVLAVVEDPAQATLVYAIDFPVFPNTDIQKQLAEKIRAELNKLVDGRFPGLTVKPTVIEARGGVAAEIMSFADKVNADAIVVSSHGRTGMSRLLIGSVAERIVRESTRPVLIVPCRKK